MKKVFGLLAAAAVLSSGFSLAQSDQSHDVNIKIPDVLRIRLTSGASNAAVANPTPVEFDFVANQAIFDVGDYGPTNTGSFNWDDVKVFSNDADGWEVRVATVNNSADVFDWSKVTVRHGGANANVTADFDIAGGSIADNNAKTGGWESLGFGPNDYTISFDGSEDAGDYNGTVTYDIFGL